MEMPKMMIAVPLFFKGHSFGKMDMYEAKEMDTYLTEIKEEGDGLRASIKGFKIWYMTLRNHNPDSFMQLKEIIPISIINRFEEALKKGGA